MPMEKAHDREIIYKSAIFPTCHPHSPPADLPAPPGARGSLQARHLPRLQPRGAAAVGAVELHQVLPEQLTGDQLQLQVVEGLGDNPAWIGKYNT